MTKGKGQKDKRTNNTFPLVILLFVLLSFSFGYCVICPFVLFLWLLCYLSFCPFPLVIVLFVLLSFSFGHCVICPFALFLWPLCYLSFCPFPLAIVLFVLLSFSFGHCVICKGQITKWPKEKGKRTNNQMAKGKGQKDK
jgi:hypothetical protein